MGTTRRSTLNLTYREFWEISMYGARARYLLFGAAGRLYCLRPLPKFLCIING